MTPQEYISSGMIEMYALGSLSVDEMKEVENMAAQFPEVKAELERVQADLGNYSSAYSVTPDPSLKEKIMRSAFGDRPEAKVVELKPSFNWKNLAIAASIVLILTVGYIGYLESKMNGLRDELSSVRDGFNKRQEIIDKQDSNNAVLRNQLVTQHWQMEMLGDTMTMNIPLNSILVGHPMKSVVHWNKRSMEVAIEPMTLPMNDSTNKYVLWAIADGVPVNKGSFEMTEQTGIVMIDNVTKADAFAISLETDADVDKPAGPIYVMGKPGLGH